MKSILFLRSIERAENWSAMSGQTYVVLRGWQTWHWGPVGTKGGPVAATVMGTER